MLATTGLTLHVSEATIIPYHSTIMCGRKNRWYIITAWAVSGLCHTKLLRSFFMNGLTQFLILRGSTKQDANLLHMCSYSTRRTILLIVVCVPTASRDAQAFCLGISTPNRTHCLYTKLVKRHKAAVQNTAMNSMLLVFSCILVLPVWYISCWMTFKVDSLLLFIS